LRPFEDKDRRLKIALNVIVLSAAFIAMAFRSPELERVSSFEKVMIDVLAPVQRGVTSFHQNISSFFNDYLFNIEASQKNRELHQEIADFKSQIFSFKEMVEENRRLKKLLEFGSEIPYRKVLSRVVSWDAASDMKVIRINKGSTDGVKLQSPVMTAQGLVGYVYRLTENFSDILTIVDSNNRVDALIKRVRSHGIVEGNNNDKMLVKYISRSEPVVLGDVVMTSGLGNVYPKGLMVGKVTRIAREIYGITQSIEVSPSVDFNRLEEVIVLAFEDDEEKRVEWKALDKAESSDSKEAK